MALSDSSDADEKEDQRVLDQRSGNGEHRRRWFVDWDVEVPRPAHAVSVDPLILV